MATSTASKPLADITSMKWIKLNLGPIMAKAIADSKTTWIDEALLGAMAYREGGIFVSKYRISHNLAEMSALTRGDYSRRTGDSEPEYHGFGFWQIDIDSFEDFVKSGGWKDPYKACMKAISVLEGKRKYISSEFKLPAPVLLQACLAAYNCGEGNVSKVITAKQDIDSRTTHKNYSANVLELKDLYQKL